MAFYALKNHLTTETAILGLGQGLEAPFTNWIRAIPWSVAVPTPLPLVVEENGRLLPFYENPIPVMKESLLNVVRYSGVNNIDDYEVEIFNPFDERVYDDYRAINVIGAIEAIDEELSDGENLYGSGSCFSGKFYDEIILDESKIGDLLLFRLAEKLSLIVVSDLIRNKIIEKFSEEGFYFKPLFEDDDDDYNEDDW